MVYNDPKPLRVRNPNLAFLQPRVDDSLEPVSTLNFDLCGQQVPLEFIDTRFKSFMIKEFYFDDLLVIVEQMRTNPDLIDFAQNCH